MAEANARLEFLWKASHLLLSQCPGASSHYMSQFLSLANSRDLRLHEDIQAKSCAACGSIFIPGVNSKVRVVPVNETKVEREKRKKANRKKAKIEKLKCSKGGSTSDTTKKDVRSIDGSDTEMTVTAQSATATSSTFATALAVEQQQCASALPQKSSRKVIRITPYTELAQQQQSQQQQRRLIGGNRTDGDSAKKTEKRANQLLNHVIYSCQRCNWDTELPGTKEGYLNTRIKIPKSISQRRKLKAEQKQSGAAPEPASNVTTPISVGSNSDKTTLHPKANSKRPVSVISPPGLPDNKRPKHSTSMPASPVGGLSRVSSAASSAASSPVSSPRVPAPDNGKLGGGGANRKKKKGGLAGLLASQQKPKDPSNEGSSGSGGDSVLANFLMGL
ncbi:hypothetical protein BGX21_010391 [Mortierella sp. AD011]|nr:hypothetical protein BGX21_010391 [Mortierella sp. AD011]